MSVDRVTQLFQVAYGRQPAVVASAPGRVNLIGEHTDYNGGEVLPIAIARRTYVAMGPGVLGGRSRAVSGDRGEVGEWEPGAKAEGIWWDYVAGSLAEAQSLGAAREGRDVAVVSDVPMGAGLSSSAALEVATILAALAVDGVSAPGNAVALAAHRAETQHVGVNSGIMDQYASALCTVGQALHLYCATGETECVPFSRGVLIVDTATPRALRTSAFNTRRSECEAALAILRRHDPSLAWLAEATPELLERAALPAPLDARARHVVSETQRVRDFIEASTHDAPIGGLLNASHRSLRDDYECSTPELDWVVEHSVARVGIEGARLTGAGWGGCAIIVGEEEALQAITPEIVHAFQQSWDRAPRVWLTTASAGARVDQAWEGRG